MKYYLSLFLLFVLFLQGCQEDNVPRNHLKFYWDQTGCADPWSTSANNSSEEIHEAIEDYLKDEGIRNPRVISTTQDGTQEGCFACTCTTGNRFNVTAPKNQKSKMIALGFVEV